MKDQESSASLSSSHRLIDQPSETPVKSRKRRRLRRLADSDKNINLQLQRTFRQQLKRYVIGSLVLMAALAVLIGHIFRQNESKSSALGNFLSSYHKHYKQITTGKEDYCDRPFDSFVIFGRIREQRRVLNQERALLQMELALRNNSNFVSLALVGPPGIGKTLAERALVENFPWRENVHTYAWNTFVRDEIDKIAAVQMLADRFSDCGHNLLVIENLQPKHRQVITCLNNLLLTATQKTSDKRPKKLIVLYIFSLNTFEEKEEYMLHHMELQQLPNTRTINFKAFGEKELRDCIKRGAELENITLSAHNTKDIVSSIDPERSGCKNVYAKLRLYGKVLNTKEIK